MEDSSPGGNTSEDTLFADLSLSSTPGGPPEDMLMPSGPERIVRPTPENKTVEVGGAAAVVEEGMKLGSAGGIGGIGGPPVGG